MNQADKQEIRANLLFAFAPALADAIAKEHWNAKAHAKAFQTAIDVLVPTSSTVSCAKEIQSEQNAITNLVPWQHRVVVEEVELGYKIMKLQQYMESPEFNYLGDAEQTTIHAQFNYMGSYRRILEQRIALFVNETK
jgi:hypothetical protein